MRRGRDPLVWSAAALILLTFGLPFAKPLFAALFPQLERPLYQADPFWLLLLQHLAWSPPPALPPRASGLVRRFL
ncbi:hypothetical protein [Elstera litoralis]|uniref:hypothetical protein n=1 Tax=Elstera litoralis TaxID=552518 RepID=UPI001E63E2B4|nr:hypothetical protein [Elstera litoralis]